MTYEEAIAAYDAARAAFAAAVVYDAMDAAAYPAYHAALAKLIAAIDDAAHAAYRALPAALAAKADL